MESGRLTVRAWEPVEGTPGWVTLEVVHGGFATGRYLTEAEDAGEVNDRYLSDEGRLEALQSGRCRVEVPEEAALAVVGVLLDKGFSDEALGLLEEIGPWMGRLRFVPRMAERASASGTAVRVRTVGEVAEDLREITVPQQIAAMRETLGVWDRCTTG